MSVDAHWWFTQFVKPRIKVNFRYYIEMQDIDSQSSGVKEEHYALFRADF